MVNWRKYILWTSLALLAAACSPGKKKDRQQSVASKDSIVTISRQIDAHNNNAALYIRRSHFYHNRHQLELAIRDAVHGVNIDSMQPAWYSYLADLYMKRPYVKGALISLERAAHLKPDDKNLYLRLGKLFFEVKNRPKSFLYLNKALRLDPYLAEAFYYRGYNYREMNNSAKAIENFEQAVQLNPRYFDAYLQLGLLYAAQKDRRAEEYYSSALTIRPQDRRALYARGMYYQSVDSTQKAINDYKQILRNDPQDKAANYNLGYNFFLLKDYSKAKKYFSAAIAADPDYAQAYEGRGQSELRLHENATAAQDLAKSKALSKKAKVHHDR